MAGRCPFQRKVIYPDKSFAEAARAGMVKDHPAEEFRVYECPHCFGWHIGHSKRKVKNGY